MAGAIKKSAKKTRKKRVNSFFAGIGGFDLAFEEEGYTPSFYCENNEFCRGVLERHWGHVENAEDISALRSEVIPEAEVWTAGFPCQDLSMARTPHGKRSGLKGSQSGLFYTFLQHLSVHKPPVVLLENVAGLLSSHKGADFTALVQSLTELGYAVSWRLLNARYFGVPQSRPRIFICAWLGSIENAVASLYEDEISIKPKNEREGFLKESKCKDSIISVPQISFCISATSGRHTGLDWARTYVTYPDKVRRLTPKECERLQGLPPDWTIPSDNYVIPIRGIETNRYHAIGNAVCVPVVRWIAKRIKAILDKDGLNVTTPSNMENLVHQVMSSKVKISNLYNGSLERKWQTGGVAYGNIYATTAVSPSPIKPISTKLIDLIEKDHVASRYFISENAMQGILRRVDKLGRNLFPPLDETLRKLATIESVDADDIQFTIEVETKLDKIG
ncbi:Modification methylase HhaI [Serratia marcescens]|uniref:DNA cytosine methyltransferase n=1 Tax=Serratia TaxID=613 RepID=UPI0007456908|nr:MULTISPECIES: DNA (cytosine-5-)-methyltransferase [Serratia]CUZ29874.1 Modification methylase HhaI [Serratia marcescens]CUZ88464.1 Modification methylase HhaI [Serratia marcescens]CVA02329.1 Modification methylase HhaI [Serratia marcescens]CVA11866.1 Modification methylase HhaI [Serratia marcescens]CVA33770.1 Modification methylase HhaI [Serratia marcescens]